MKALLGFALVALLGAAASGCSKAGGAEPRSAEIARAIASGDDHSRCEYKGRSDREAVESSGPGSEKFNIRRVYLVVASGEERRRVLVCREVDTNLDGVKDLYRRYDDRGVALEEEADADYDGKVDTWIKFAAGRLLKVEVDTDRDGHIDESRYYVRGKLSRVQRDTNRDGKPDVWEIYGDNQLTRVGFDLDFDGRVDRWARDEIAYQLAEKKEREEEERLAREQAEKQKAAGADESKPAEGYVSPRKR
jgi:hypothetical protein